MSGVLPNRTAPIGEASAFVDDKALALAFQQGERNAYEAIYERHRARVESVCYRMLSQREDAQEAVQETFLRVYQGLPRFNGRYQLGAWIARIATNVCLDQIRGRARRPAEPVAIEVMEEKTPPLPAADPESLCIRKAEGERVREMLASLPPKQRTAITLRDFEGLSYEEVGALMGVTDLQVKALLHRARVRFRRAWVTSVGAFLPARLLHRIRRLDAPAREQAAQAAGSAVQAATPATVSSCSALLQQCGTFFGERAAAALGALVVSTAAVSGATMATADPQAAAPAVVQEEAKSLGSASSEKEKGSEELTRLPQDAEREVAAPADSDPPPVEPEPTPPSEPEEGTVPDDAGEQDPSEETPSSEPTPTEPPLAPEPQDFLLGVSTDAAPDSGVPGAPTTVLKEWVKVSEKDGLSYLNQSLQGSATTSDGSSLGLSLDQWIDPSGQEAAFSLTTELGAYRYRAVGGLVDETATTWGGMSYTFVGSYEVVGRPSNSQGMPEGGSYSSVVTVSWRQQRVVSVTLAMQEG